jgi:CRP/FNR family transcriptional regulator
MDGIEGMPLPLHPILRSARLKHFPKSQILLYKEDIPSDVYVVKTGMVKLYDIDDNGNEKILHIVKSPSLLPFPFFSSDGNRVNWFYVTLTDCSMYVLPKAKLQHAIYADSSLAIFLMNAFSTDIHELLVRLSSLGKTNARDKLCASLRFLLVRHSTRQRSGWCRVSFPVNHQLLADLSGITRESTAMAMKELQNKRVVRSPKLTVLEIDREALTSVYKVDH